MPHLCPRTIAAAATLLVCAGTLAVATPAAAQAPRSAVAAVEYVEPANPLHKALYDRMKGERWLERMQSALQLFRLPRPVTLKIESCGEVDAWFARRTVGLCYEYLQVVQRRIDAGQLAPWVTPQEALAGAFVDAIFHEFGHALIEQLRLPVLGREEEAADQLSAYLMLQLGGDRADGLIRGTAHMYLGWIAFFQSRPQVPLATGAQRREARAHPTAGQRLYNLVCIALGADRATYARLAKAVELPEERAEDCSGEHALLARSWRTLVGPHIVAGREAEARAAIAFFTTLR